MGTRQNSQPGCSVLNKGEVHVAHGDARAPVGQPQIVVGRVDCLNYGWKCPTDLRREDRNGKKDLGIIHRVGWNQVGPPREKRVQSAKCLSWITNIQGVRMRQSGRKRLGGWGGRTIVWHENQVSGELRQRKRMIWQPDPTVFQYNWKRLEFHSIKLALSRMDIGAEEQ